MKNITPILFHNISKMLHKDVFSFSNKSKNCQNEGVFGVAEMEWNKCVNKKIQWL